MVVLLNQINCSYTESTINMTWSEQTDLCMWDKSLWGRPRQQQERLQGKIASGTPVWSACPSGTGGRHMLGEVQTHLRKSHKGEKRMSKHSIKINKNSTQKIWAAPDSCCLLLGTKWVFVVKKCRYQFRRFVHTAVPDRSSGHSCRCERQTQQDDIFQMHENRFL